MVWKRFLLWLILIFNYSCFSTIICKTRFKMGEKTKIVNTNGTRDVIDREMNCLVSCWYCNDWLSWSRLWIEETNELDVYETEISWNLKGLVAIAIAIAVMKKSLAAAEPTIQFSETPPRWERALDRLRGSRSPPPALCPKVERNS